MRNNEKIKEESIQLFLKGKTISEIAKTLKYSREHISRLIKDDPKIKLYRNKKIAYIYKRKTKSEMTVSIPTAFWKKIGISMNTNINEKVEISVDEQEKMIIIKRTESNI